ncbi:hemerythrin family protein [Clostridium gasigenes]|uniref:Hemerythrin family protein n=1 Tax=Clostridium gasigenes TaxID=94869 RepID=A0A7X0RCF9_9CLOT|nr:hemerythrin family protein [Clostridium gasigenes]MBB6624548.1 hemerythrin family protein [Clostridium gasigenes]MBB6713164.1 hemerythrin family protein [Clostridium gasigenes]MBU3136994.1 hemerythrin family protein [Clostridium gasigenes]
MFEMKEEYKTGIKKIDVEHEKLFEIGERAYQLLKDKYINDKFDKIVTIIGELREYTVHHFAEEEAYMESINYKRLFTQKMDHIGFIKKIDEVNFNEIDKNQDEAIMGLLTFLNDWLVNHILEKDLLIPAK